MKLVILSVLICWMSVSVVRADGWQVGFTEEYGLADDRRKALEQLVPGSPDYYFYHCLHAQQTKDLDRARALLDTWIKRDGYTERASGLLDRQALLEYERNPKQSLAHIQKTLSLQFLHQRRADREAAAYPSALPPDAIAFATLMDEAFRRYRNLDGVTDAGLAALPHGSLNAGRRRDLLQRLARPVIPNLAQLVTADLREPHSGGFGSLAIHARLTRAQLDECLRRMPGLRENSAFIQAYLTKLAPSEDADPLRDPAVRLAHLERMWSFVADLPPAHNDLKANTLFGLLAHHLDNEAYDAARPLFMTYIALPRQVGYIEPGYLKGFDPRREVANLSRSFSGATGLPPVRSDEALVRDYLAHYLLNAPDYGAFVRYIKDDFLKTIFAETKLTAGAGDMERWYAMLSPEALRRLRERVDLQFAPSNRKRFAADAPVSLDLFVKNVDTLTIKIFEINAFNYYAARGEEIDTTIDLDGLVAAEERLVRYDLPPLRRERRSFDFPEIKAPGIYVVEFIGGGRGSRAVIRKGGLWFTETPGPAGHEFRVYDETGAHRPGAGLWLSGRRYDADPATGLIIVPYSTHPETATVILKDGPRCSLDAFEHQAETYALAAGIHADREELLRQRKARVILRPALMLNDRPVSLALLEDVRLVIATRDLDDVAASREYANIEISEDKDAVIEFLVPEKLRAITFRLLARVKNVTQAETVDLSDETAFTLNEIDTTLYTRDLFLSRTADGHLLRALGKNGEPSPDLPVEVTFLHRFFKDPVTVMLQTDKTGRIDLGPLADISQINAKSPDGLESGWPILRDRYDRPALLHGRAGGTLRLPWSDGDGRFSLLERRGETYAADYTDAVTLTEGFLEITGLPAGDYELALPSEDRIIAIRLTDGKADDGALISESRTLELSPTAPLQISRIAADGKALVVQLANATEFARLHLLATRFAPPYDPYQDLLTPGPPPPFALRPARPESQYVAERDIGDEYRYILDRRHAEKFPGNMLGRPELLLNPWPVRKTETGTQAARAGDDYDRVAQAPGARYGAGREGRERPTANRDFSNLDFLSRTTIARLNLKPDADGRISIPRAELADATFLNLVAISPDETVYRQFALPETAIDKRDARLTVPLPPDRHFTEQQRVSALDAGAPFIVEDMAGAVFEPYDSLARVFAFFSAMETDPRLRDFSFLMNWPEMDAAARAEKYAEYACHELNFFLYHKDPEFFHSVIRDYIANKKDKTFMDHWLLGSDLSGYLEPYAFSRLNLVEKILLARRGPADEKAMAGFVKDRHDLIPPDAERDRFLFDTALAGRRLEGGMYAEAAAAMEDMTMAASAMPAPPAPAMAKSVQRVMKMAADNLGMAGKSEEALPEMALEMDLAAGSGVAKPTAKFGRPRRQAARDAVRPFFKSLEKTMEWAENNYYQLPIADQNADLIPVNAFWRDYALSPAGAPFRSPHFIRATANLTEMLLALSALDLPFAAPEHETRMEGPSFHMEPGGPMILFHQSIQPADAAANAPPILVSQGYFRPDDRYRYEGGDRRDKFITEEFLYRVPYGCQVVVGNPTSARRRLRLLMQIPKGAMPLSNGFFTEGMPLVVEPYATQTFTYHFYFPETGEFAHYPVQVSEEDAVAAGADPFSFHVVRRLEKMDTTSWEYISQNGAAAEVMGFLSEANLNRIDLEMIAFRMRDKSFYKKCLDTLSGRYEYHPALWSYALYHNDAPRIREYLSRSPYADRVGIYLDSPLLTVDPVDRKKYEHLEYHPLVNARVHTLGGVRKILNDRLAAQYRAFLDFMTYRPRLTDSDRLAAVYYLLLQDRVADALGHFETIDPNRLDDGVAERLQYDYARIYLAFYTGDMDLARRLAAAHLNHPVPRWQKRFQQAADQLTEMTGGAARVADEKDRDQRQAQLAATEPALDFSVEAGVIAIRYQNLTECRIDYYPMEIELLFSKSPFVAQGADHFAFIQPRLRQEISLPPDAGSHSAPIPEEFRNRNLTIEIVAGGIRKSQAHYANALDVQVIETYGHLRVADAESGAPLPLVYVKVYARSQGGDVAFYKDGYTDLRGRFDYVSLSTDALDRVERFAILVLSEQKGGLIREAAPPKR